MQQKSDNVQITFKSTPTYCMTSCSPSVSSLVTSGTMGGLGKEVEPDEEATEVVVTVGGAGLMGSV
jgi:hypothetical protein